MLALFVAVEVGEFDSSIAELRAVLALFDAVEVGEVNTAIARGDCTTDPSASSPALTSGGDVCFVCVVVEYECKPPGKVCGEVCCRDKTD